MSVEDDDKKAVLFALRELDRFAYTAEPLGPERLLELLVEGPRSREERRVLGIVLQSPRSAEHLQQLVGLGAVPRAALVRTVRSLAAADVLSNGRVSGLRRDDLIAVAEELRDAQDKRAGSPDTAAATPRRRPGRPVADPTSGPRTDAERQQAIVQRQAARGFQKTFVLLSPEALAALDALQSRAGSEATLKDVINAALIAAAARIDD